MEPFPHTYSVTASESEELVCIQSPGITTLHTAAPAEFGGPGNQWSPETLFAASIADCFILTFKAIASASKFSYTHLSCQVDAVLERPDRLTRFTQVTIKPSLMINDPADEEKGIKLLEKAEAACLITNSLTARLTLEIAVSAS